MAASASRALAGREGVAAMGRSLARGYSAGLAASTGAFVAARRASCTSRWAM
jgi:hypothetical protein